MTPDSAHSAEETVRAWASAVDSRQIEAVMACYTDPLLVYDVVGPLKREGMALYRKCWEDEFFPWRGGSGHFKLGDLSVHEGEEVAFATGMIDCAGSERGRAVQYMLRLTLGLVRTSAGWRIIHEHSSEPTPFETAV